MAERGLLVALTGGIASGKSTAAAFFREAGARLVDADQVARDVVEPGSPALEEIRREFGASVIRADGRLDRERMGALVFGNDAALVRLNGIVHPRVGAEVKRRFRRIWEDEPTALVVYDVPLLFESGLDTRFEWVVVAYVPRPTQLERLMQRDQLSEADAERRLASQLDIEEKARRADFVLDNRGPVEALRKQVQAVVERLRNEAAEMDGED